MITATELALVLFNVAVGQASTWWDEAVQQIATLVGAVVDIEVNPPVSGARVGGKVQAGSGLVTQIARDVGVARFVRINPYKASW